MQRLRGQVAKLLRVCPPLEPLRRGRGTPIIVLMAVMLRAADLFISIPFLCVDFYFLIMVIDAKQ